MRNTIGQRFQRRIDVPVWLEHRQLDYADKVLSVAPNNLIAYWKMDEAAGGVAVDSSPEGNDGAYTGVTLGQPGIGDGLTCPLFDGANDFNNIHSAALNADFDGAEGSLVIWVRLNGVGVWTDGANRFCINLRVNNNNRIHIQKPNSNSRLQWLYRAGAVVSQREETALSITDWMTLGFTWSAGADEAIAYRDGNQIGAILNGLGVWAGNLSATNTLIGAETTGPAAVMDGLEAHAALWAGAGGVLSQPEMANLAIP